MKPRNPVLDHLLASTDDYVSSGVPHRADMAGLAMAISTRHNENQFRVLPSVLWMGRRHWSHYSRPKWQAEGQGAEHTEVVPRCPPPACAGLQICLLSWTPMGEVRMATALAAALPPPLAVPETRTTLQWAWSPSSIVTYAYACP